MTKRYGAAGGASVWMLLNGGYLTFTIYFMHRRLLKNEKWRWYLQDVCLPLAASVLIAGAGRLFLTGTLPPLAMFLYIALVSVATLAVTAMATGTTRVWILAKVSGLRPQLSVSE
jgi:predicted membrane metal-binding protein